MRKLKMAAITLVMLAGLALPGARLVRVGAGRSWSLRPAVILAGDCASATSCGGH